MKTGFLKPHIYFADGKWRVRIYTGSFSFLIHSWNVSASWFCTRKNVTEITCN